MTIATRAPPEQLKLRAQKVTLLTLHEQKAEVEAVRLDVQRNPPKPRECSPERQMLRLRCPCRTSKEVHHL